MIDKIMNAPINLYFDTTPIGRILNRFSKDLSVLDLNCVFILGTFYVNLYQLISTIVISIVIVPWISFYFPIMFIIVLWLYKKSISATKEVSRIESVTKSPLLSFLSETL